MDDRDEEASTSEDTVAYWESLLRSEDLSSTDRVACLINLANALADSAEVQGRPDLAQDGVKYGLLALNHPPPTHQIRLTILSDLSTIYMTLFELQGDQADLNESLIKIRSAVSETHTNDNKRCVRLANLCNTLCMQFEAFGGREHIDEAIRVGQEAIRVSGAQLDVRAKALGNVARAFGLRNQAFYVQSDSDNAIQSTREAIEIAEDPEVKAICRSNLVGLLLSDMERQCKDEIVAEALEIGNVAIRDLDPPHEAMCLHNMSYLLRLQYEQGNRLGDPSALQTAVDHAVAAINTYPGEDAQLAMFEDQLAMCLEQAFLQGDLEALSTGISMARNAVSRTQQLNRLNASYKNHLASLLKRRGESTDLDDAILLSRSVLNNGDAALIEKIDASNTCSLIMAHLHDWDAAYITLREGIHFMSSVVRAAMSRADQQYVLGQLGSLSQKAASFALLSGRTPQEALEVLESGRVMLTRLSILERSGLPIEVERHQSVQPLLPRYREIKALLQNRPANTGSTESPDARTENATHTIRRTLQAELDDLVAQIERLTHWQEAAMSSSLFSPRLLGSDYAVAINVTKVSADALIVVGSRVTLPKLLPQDLEKYVGYLVGGDKITDYDVPSYRSANQKMLQLLVWL